QSGPLAPPTGPDRGPMPTGRTTMNPPSRLILAALAAFVLVPTTARADVRPVASAFALPSPSVADMITRLVPVANEPAAPETPVTLALAQGPAPGHVEFSGLHYVPRGRGHRP